MLGGVLAASAWMLIVAAPAIAAPPAPTPIGGYSGAGKPVPPGARGEIPYEADFLAGATEIGEARVKRIAGSGRLLVRVSVRYPSLRDQTALLLSEDATYRGRVVVTLHRGPADRSIKVSDGAALPLGAAADTGPFLHEIVVPRSESRRLRAGASNGEGEEVGEARRPQLFARAHAVARFDQFGAGRPEEDSADSGRRSTRMTEAPPGAAGAAHWPCAADADLHSRPGPASTYTHRTYAGQAFPHVGRSVTFRLCLASDRPFDLQDWYWNGDDDHAGEQLPQKTARGTISAPTIDNGYVTVTWTPDPGVNGGPHDRLLFGVNRRRGDIGEEPHDHFEITIVPRAFEMRALGDSITAGWGYLGDGSAPQLSGSDGDFDFPQMLRCAPPDDGSFNNRCSSNSDAPAGYAPEDKRFSADTGLRNNVAWPAQFATRHGIPFRTPDGQFATYGNYAVSGGRPEHFVPGGKFYNVLDERIVAYDPDLTVLTLGANPILSDFLADKDIGKRCGADPGTTRPKIVIDKATKCMRDQVDKYAVYERLRGVFRRLLDAPSNHIVVATYPNAYSALPFVLATKYFVNNYPPYVIERSVQVLNTAIRFAVEDENARARKAGQGTRIFLVSPQRFDFGLPGLGQATGSSQGVSCPTKTGLGFNVDGPSNQSAATQSARSGKLCPSASASDVYFESLDGGLHLSRNGAGQYADALDQKVREIGLTVPGS